MPVQACTSEGKQGYRWGTSGHCYIYEANNEASRREAKRQSFLQASAIQHSQERRGEKPKVFDFVKQFDSELTAPQEISEALQQQIDRHAGEAVPADEIMVRYARLANDLYDRSHERFPREYLARFAETIPPPS